MKRRSRKTKNKQRKILLLPIVILLGFTGSIGLTQFLTVGDISTNSTISFEVESALEALEKKKETTPIPSYQFKAPLQPVLDSAPDQKLIQSYKQTHLEEILNKHVKAMGGWKNWKEVESIRTVGIVERENKEFPIVIIKKRPNLLRATVKIPTTNHESEMRVVRAFDGDQAWSATYFAGNRDFNKEYLSQAAAQDLVMDAGVLPPLIKFWQEGAILKIIGHKMINGDPHYMIEAKFRDFPNKYVFYLSPKNYLVSQYDSIDDSAGITRTVLKDYVTEQGVRIPKLTITYSEKIGSTFITTKSIKIGVGIHQEYFQAEIVRSTQNSDTL